MMKRINFYEEEVEMDVLGEVNLYEVEYYSDEDLQEYIKINHEEYLEKFLTRA